MVPARLYSKGVPRKNLRQLNGKSLVRLAVECAIAAGCDEVWVNCIVDMWRQLDVRGDVVRYWPRPLALDADDTPMFAVFDEMLKGGCFTSEDDIILNLQPTQPLRTPEHVRAAIALLRETQADSVVSVVELPKTHSPDVVLDICGGRLSHALYDEYDDYYRLKFPDRRQDLGPYYVRDGTVYAFWRKTVARHGSIYGYDARPLIIPPEQTCELDSEADWAALEARVKA